MTSPRKRRIRLGALAALALIAFSGAAGCAEVQPVEADPEEVEAAVKHANESAAEAKRTAASR